MRYTDSHAHYYDERFASPECPSGVHALLDGLFADRVDTIINIGTDPQTSRAAIAQAKAYERMFCAVGIHPTDGQRLASFDDALCDIRALAQDPENKCVCIGEIGLDYHYPDTDRASQMYLFGAQLELAEALDLPVSVHDRDAHGDVMDILRAHPHVRGVVHSFSGSAEMAKELVSRGFYISFSGTLTFTNGRRAAEAAAVVPPTQVLIETDAPYLAPHPLRGQLNHSGNLLYTNRRLAQILGMSEEACARQTAENAARLFRLPH